MSDLPGCEMCGQPYHRYGLSDPEHKYDAMGCVNALRGRVEKFDALAKAAQAVLAVWDGQWEIDDWFGGDDDPPVMHVLRDAVVAAGYELLPRPTLPDGAEAPCPTV